MASEDKIENPENIVFNLSNKDNYRKTLDDPIILIQLSHIPKDLFIFYLVLKRSASK